ncbi:MAG: hypothetical protein ISR58_10585 [Anaerolineales bacterium]|nr:hypothetical protein [Anaerolineales bacterium]
MFGLDKTDSLFVFWAFVMQFCLILLFAIRKTNLDFILKYGWIFYLLSIPAVIVSIIMLRGGKGFTFWIGGFIFLVWAIFGYIVEYRFGIKWRDPIVVSILIPYVLLYLGTIMFYWFPLGILGRPLWYFYGVLFALGTYFNITSH